MGDPQITVISVAYASADVLPGMADSLPPGSDLIVVDNGPDDGLRAWAAGRGIRLIVAPRNLGFGRACNLGAEAAAGEWLLFLNPDARLLPDTMDELRRAIARHPTAAAFGLCLLDDAGRPGYKRRSRLDPTGREAPRSVPAEDTEVPVLSGAALAVRAAAFRAVGGFDPGIFLYYEDDDLSFRLRATQGPLVFLPAARVTHLSGQSSAPSAALSRFKGYHWARSRIHVARKHGLRWPWLSGLRNALWHLVSPRAWRSAERRAEAWGRLHGVFSMLRGPAAVDKHAAGP